MSTNIWLSNLICLILSITFLNLISTLSLQFCFLCSDPERSGSEHKKQNCRESVEMRFKKVMLKIRHIKLDNHIFVLIQPLTIVNGLA